LQEDVVKSAPWVSEAWPPPAIHESVAYSVDRALANGLTQDLDIRNFVSMMFIIGPDFDQHPEIQKVLSNASLSPVQRWEKLAEDPAYHDAWQQLSDPIHQSEWFCEARGHIEDAYPTTYMLPGFVALYNKIREEQYPFLAPGESLDDEDDKDVPAT
ncbi:MAG: hypothetical protein K2O70_03395, partial [Desulfovibrionaceae bacterium]|nr:hypothetical protein [Desulfovibrionaceae bacterium]